MQRKKMDLFHSQYFTHRKKVKTIIAVLKTSGLWKTKFPNHFVLSIDIR